MNRVEYAPGSLFSNLSYAPQELKFGTSGRRGEVIHLTQLEVYLNALAELEFLQSIPSSEGGIKQGDEFYFGYDLRASSCLYVPEFQDRGELAQAIERAICDAGMKPVNLGQIPTPALACHALMKGRGSIMVTGSHIPFNCNGYKTNTSVGELLKKHEFPINAKVCEVRSRLYAQPFSASPFDENGRFKSGHQVLMPADKAGEENYIRRYVDFFERETLKAMRLVVYQHSAVGRDLMVGMLRRLGAEVIATGRSDTFVPIDTENMGAEQLGSIQQLHDTASARFGSIDAIISTDGDSDRPMILGVEDGKVHFFGGDRVGMVTADYLRADAVVVPISCNDGIDLGSLKAITAPKTKIGSPYVIAGMLKELDSGKQAVCGFEANGGFLTGSDFFREGKRLGALPTRDAMLPILTVLVSAREKGLSLCGLFESLPKRYSQSALLKEFPRSIGQSIIDRFSTKDLRVTELHYDDGNAMLFDENLRSICSDDYSLRLAKATLLELADFFRPAMGFGEISRINYLDGMRLYFDNGEVAHIRPSGNADELRIYAVANTQERADAIVNLAIQEPNGILRRLEKSAI